MGKGLESTGVNKALDADVERDGATEINYDEESYSYLFEENEPEVETIELWSGQDIGRDTRDVLKPEKTKVESIEWEAMLEIAEKDKVNPALQEEFDKIVDEMEGIF